MTPTDKPTPMTVDALMDMAFDLEIAARDYHCAPDKYLQQELIDARAELRAAIEQYGREQAYGDAYQGARQDLLMWKRRALAAEQRGSGEPVANARKIAAEQAEDDGLWFVAQSASEAYLQQELRRITAAIESAPQPREPLTDEQEREAFEAWCIKRWAGDRNALGRNPVDPASPYSGKYKAGNVEFAWRAWMARAHNIRSEK